MPPSQNDFSLENQFQSDSGRCSCLHWFSISPGIFLISICLQINNISLKPCLLSMVIIMLALSSLLVILIFISLRLMQMIVTHRSLISLSSKISSLLLSGDALASWHCASSLYNGSIRHNFQEIHYIVVKRFLEYLCGATNYAMCYYSVSTENQIMLAYTEANYACRWSQWPQESQWFHFLS